MVVQEFLDCNSDVATLPRTCTLFARGDSRQPQVIRDSGRRMFVTYGKEWEMFIPIGRTNDTFNIIR